MVLRAETPVRNTISVAALGKVNNDFTGSFSVKKKQHLLSIGFSYQVKTSLRKVQQEKCEVFR